MPKERSISIHLTKKQVEQLERLQKDPELNFTLSTRVAALLALNDSDATYREIAEKVGVSEQTAARIAKLYVKEGLDAVIKLKRNPNSDRANVKLDQNAKEKLFALVQGPPPKGHENWTVRLLAKEAQKILDKPVSAATISRLFQNPDKAKELTGFFSRKPARSKGDQDEI